MWLINTKTLKLENFVNPVPKSYAILSHTWEDGEVSFQDFKDLVIAQEIKGFSKIANTCKLSLSQGFSHAWVDTCCIDKTSSAELSEAINSMFRWYQNSAVCFVYLSDLESHARPDSSGLQNCRWFSRGWTLQEFIAPRSVEFYNAHWQLIARKADITTELMQVTGILEDVLNTNKIRQRLNSIPVCTKIGWLANRQTTRIEDMAYCLLGLLDVNMPMLYGEGDNAFIRLQEEFCRQTNDLSLLSWTAVPTVLNTTIPSYHGILASHPRDFGRLLPGLIQVSVDFDLNTWPFDFLHCELSVTNRGLKMDNPRLLEASNCMVFLDLGLDYTSQTSDAKTVDEKLRVGIYIDFTPAGYVRSQPDRLAILPRRELGARIASPQINLQKVSNNYGARIDEYLHSNYRLLFVKIEKLSFNSLDILDAAPSSSWSHNTQAFVFATSTDFSGFLQVNIRVDDKVQQAILVCLYKGRRHDQSSAGHGYWVYHLVVEASPDWRFWARAEITGLDGLFQSGRFREYIQLVRKDLCTRVKAQKTSVHLDESNMNFTLAQSHKVDGFSHHEESEQVLLKLEPVTS